MRRLLLVVLAAASLGAATRRDRLEAVPQLASLLYSNMLTESDYGCPPGVAAVGRRRDVLRVSWGGCREGTIAYNFRPIDGFEDALRGLAFRRVDCADASGRVVDAWVLAP